MTTQPHAPPAPPIAGGPETAIPQTDIPHMGTSQAKITNPGQPMGHTAQPHAPVQPQPQHTPQSTQLPPLPPGITQEAVNQAIAHVQQTGTTDGIAPDVLAAACAQIEAQAKAQGIDLTTQLEQSTPPSGPTNYVEAAVMDKQGTIDQFGEQRDALKAAVAEQRDAMQQPYQDALAKVGAAKNSGSMNADQMKQLVDAIKDLDPAMINLINAFGTVSANPSVLNSVIWVEIIRTLRRLIADEAQKQIHTALHA